MIYTKARYPFSLHIVCIILVSLSVTFDAFAQYAEKPVLDPLPSWQAGDTKSAILSFVEQVTDSDSGHFVAPEQRIATFDNDGTLWAEQPIYGQLLFAFYRVGQLASQHPEWQTEQPFASLLKGDVAKALSSSEDAAEKIVLATQTGMSNDEFKYMAKQWVTESTHPVTGRKTIDMVYQPMLELLNYLRANQFKTYMVSGGDTQFLQAWSELAYGIPAEQVIGSTVAQSLTVKDGEAKVIRQGEIAIYNNKDNKAIAIANKIGIRPIAAFGNSDGDLSMLQYTTMAPGLRFAMIIHHTDEIREWRYDRKSKIGHLNNALDEAHKHGWTIVDMKRDWKAIFNRE